MLRNETAEGFPVEFLGFVAGELEHAKRLLRLGRQVEPPAVAGNGRASSAMIHFFHAADAGSGGVPPFWPALACQSACNVWVRRVVFSRRSSLTVRKRKISTDQRTGRTRSFARSSAPPSMSALQESGGRRELIRIGVAGSAEGMAAFDTRDGKLQPA